ncbi:hypothetical protein SRABI128_06401 [Microbacterium sp. Bi128]|nr:hypothetical protein SRABI128_06401 [Microbacterium sp. Bi128]
MIPVGAPTTLFSARRPMSASSARPRPAPVRSERANATAHSRAAEEDSPAPTGTSEVTYRSKPGTVMPARSSSHATPAGYADQPAAWSGAKVSRSNSTGSAAANAEASRTVRSARADTATVVVRLMANGRTRPSL